MSYSRWIYDEWRILLRLSHDWTPSDNQVSRMRELFSLMPAPGIDRYSELRHIESRLGLEVTSAKSVMHRFGIRERRHLELLVE